MLTSNYPLCPTDGRSSAPAGAAPEWRRGYPWTVAFPAYRGRNEIRALEPRIAREC